MIVHHIITLGGSLMSLARTQKGGRILKTFRQVTFSFQQVQKLNPPAATRCQKGLVENFDPDKPLT